MKTVLIHSGGLDSTVLLYELLKGGGEVIALSFDYGQRHRRELECSNELCNRLLVPREVIKLPFLETVPSSQTGLAEVPEGHYAAENMKVTVVPNRNMIMLAFATSMAIARRADRVAYAAHRGDHDIYPDCRPEFVEAMRQAVVLCDWHSVWLIAPFLKLSKAEIVQRGINFGVPFEQTWSCYKGLERACGRCGTCVERLEAFAIAGREDPLEYEDRDFWRTAIETK